MLWVLCPLALPPITRVVTSLWLGLSPTEDVTGGMKFKVLSEAVLVQLLRKKLANDLDDITGDRNIKVSAKSSQSSDFGGVLR